MSDVGCPGRPRTQLIAATAAPLAASGRERLGAPRGLRASVVLLRGSGALVCGDVQPVRCWRCSCCWWPAAPPPPWTCAAPGPAPAWATTWTARTGASPRSRGTCPRRRRECEYACNKSQATDQNNSLDSQTKMHHVKPVTFSVC